MTRVLAPSVVLAVLLLAGCAPTVSMTPAPEASSARCAGVVVRLPDTIGGQAERATDAQATAAWGVPASVTLTCGVTTPAVATASCTTVGGVDWLLEEREIQGLDRRVLTTYGRAPGTRVVVDPAAVSVDTVLDAVSEPIATATRRTGVRCLSVSETQQ